MSHDPQVVAHASALLAAGRAAEAARLAGQHLVTHPTDLGALTVLALARVELGEFVAAVENAAQAVAAHPDSAQAWSLLAQVRSSAGQHSGAVDAARQTVALAPDEPSTHATLSWVLLARGWRDDRSEAIGAAREAVRLTPNDPSSLCLLGDALRVDDRTFEARTTYETVLGLQPDHAGARLGLTALASDFEIDNELPALLGEQPDDELYRVAHASSSAAAALLLQVVGVIGTTLAAIMFGLNPGIATWAGLLAVGLCAALYAWVAARVIRKRWLHLPTLRRHLRLALVSLAFSPLGLLTAAVVAVLPIRPSWSAGALAAIAMAGAGLSGWIVVAIRRLQAAYDAAHPARGGEVEDEDELTAMEREFDELERQIQQLSRPIALIRYTLLVVTVLFGALPLAMLARPNGYLLTIAWALVSLAFLVAAEVMAARRRRLRRRRSVVAAVLGKELASDVGAREEMRTAAADHVARANEVQAAIKRRKATK